MKKPILILMVVLLAFAFSSCDATAPAPAEHLVTFEMNGFGTGIPSQTVLEGKLLEEPEKPTVPVMDFLGWYVDKACTVAFDFSTPITADTVLYARWERAKVVLRNGWFSGDKSAVKTIVFTNDDSLIEGLGEPDWYGDEEESAAVYVTEEDHVIVFSPGLVSAPEDASFMFCGFRAVESFQFANFHTSDVDDMSNLFDGCDHLTTLDLTGFDTSKVRRMSNMFADCSGLTAIDFSSFQTSNVEYMDSMFTSCSSLTSLDLRSFDTSKLDDVSHRFKHCSELTEILVGESWDIRDASKDFFMKSISFK